jgi:hypothetical protein
MTIIEQKQILIDAQDDLLKSHIKTFIANFQKMYIDISFNNNLTIDEAIYLRKVLDEKIKIYRGLLASLNSLTTKDKVNG